MANIISPLIFLLFIGVVVWRYNSVKKERKKKAEEDYDTFHRVNIAGGFILLRGNELEHWGKLSQAVKEKTYHAQQKLIKEKKVRIAKYKGKLWLVGPLEYERMKNDGVLEND